MLLQGLMLKVLIFSTLVFTSLHSLNVCFTKLYLHQYGTPTHMCAHKTNAELPKQKEGYKTVK